jgi:ferredoxin
VFRQKTPFFANYQDNKENTSHVQHGRSNRLTKKICGLRTVKSALNIAEALNLAVFGENKLAKTLILCDCLGSQSIDVDAISQATGLACSRVHNNLCGDEINLAAEGIASGDALIACQQERQRFEELAEELQADLPAFVDIRNRAGWGEGNVTPKMAALLAEAALPVLSRQMGGSIDVLSEGTCLLIAGPKGHEAVLQAAADLCDVLAVTVLLPQGGEISIDRRFDCAVGQLQHASGALGGFSLQIDALQEVRLGGRGPFELTDPVDGAASHCDIIIDFRGPPALFSAPEKRDGYLRADASHAPSVSKAVFTASQMIGTFEKPLYVRLEENLCAHSRAEKPACSNCLNICPTGAILSAGEHVTIDPMICAGCGSCAAVCPSGAISYDAPSIDTLFRRMNALAETFGKAGGANPRLLVHDDTSGAEMISLAARFGRGLPGSVVPLEVSGLAGFGHAEMLAALACGFAEVNILTFPNSETNVIEEQMNLAKVLGGADTVHMLQPKDPDALCDILYSETSPEVACAPILPIGSRRQVARLAAKALQPEVDVLELPSGAPYGAVLVDTEACSLCLACVSLCPSGALGDNEDLPQLRFQEDACLQCGLCSNICPEKAITLKPQMDLTDQAFTQKILHKEEPFACIECGSLFGVKSTVEKITEKLAGNHAMFANPAAAKMIQMCDNCRIQAQYHSIDNPFQGDARPRVRTTDDYLSKRRDH